MTTLAPPALDADALFLEAEVGETAVVVQPEPDDTATLVGAQNVSPRESDSAKLARKVREAKEAEARRLAALAAQGDTDTKALGDDWTAKSTESDRLRTEFKDVDATWETDLDMDKWYTAKIASLNADLAVGQAGMAYNVAIKDINAQDTAQDMIDTARGGLAKNKKQYEQITAGTHAWTQKPEGGWTFGEVKAELAGDLEEVGEPVVEEAEPGAKAELKSQLYQDLGHTPLYGERWQTIWGAEGEDVEYAGGGFWSGTHLIDWRGVPFREAKTYRPRPYDWEKRQAKDVEGFFEGKGGLTAPWRSPWTTGEVATLMDQISEEHGTAEAMNYLMDWRQDVEDGYTFAHNRRNVAEEKYVGLIKRTKQRQLVDPVELRAVRAEYEEAYKDEVALHSVRQDLTAYMMGTAPEHLDPNSRAQTRIGKWAEKQRIVNRHTGWGGSKTLPTMLHRNYVENVRYKAASATSLYAQDLVDKQSGLSEEEKGNANYAIALIMGLYADRRGARNLTQTAPPGQPGRVWIEPQYRRSYKRSKGGEELDPDAPMVTTEGKFISPIGTLRQLVDLGTDKAQREAQELAEDYDIERRAEASLSEYDHRWARSAIKLTENLTINERRAVVLALSQTLTQPGGKDQFIILAEKAVPSTGAYHPLRKAYRNAAEYDQLAVKGLIRMVEYGSTVSARQALPEAAR